MPLIVGDGQNCRTIESTNLEQSEKKNQTNFTIIIVIITIRSYLYVPSRLENRATSSSTEQ